LTAWYLFGPGIDEPLAMSRGGVVYYYDVDALGSVSAINDGDNNIQTTYAYDAWGAPKSQSGILANPFGYTARELEEADLWFYRARYYGAGVGRFLSEDSLRWYANRWMDSGTARFTSRDALENEGDPHPFAYALSNPIRNIDPYGLDSVGCTVPQPLRGLASRSCYLECCALHDACYDLFNCSDSSWTQPWKQCSPAGCAGCNEGVKVCFAKCSVNYLAGFLGNPVIPNYYCAAQHRFVSIPGTFPDFATAKQVCDHDHSKDCCGPWPGP
jgi:RHS repeat-associated protein